MDSAAVWVGGVDLDRLGAASTLEMTHGSQVRTARLLVWTHDRVRGFVELPVTAGRVAVADLRAAASALPMPEPAPAETRQGVSVVVCTRDRPEELRTCLQSLLRIREPDLEIVVVDNASRTNAAQEVVGSLDASQVRLIREDVPGLARARNTGVRAAGQGIVAFTDDDVVVDPRWLHGICRAFEAAPDVGCVTGMVPSGQLDTASQRYFDRRVTWARSTSPRVFSMDRPPVGMPLFPFQFGVYGTGANFAVRRSLLFQLGGFDEALGVGTLTGSGEDTDLFVRVLLSGRSLAYQPDAVVWHKHRADSAALTRQLQNYGVGLGAVVTKLATDRLTRRAVVARIPHAIRHLPGMLTVKDLPDGDQELPGLARAELWGMVRGPLALLRARRGSRPRPLIADGSS